jgi:ABC-2 type transport system ATP-binding protein
MTLERNDLIVRGLTKRYSAGVLANDRIDLDVRAGEVFGLLGPNGAGKTTLVRQIIGLLKPTTGSIRLGTEDLVARPDVARERCAYLPQSALPVSSFRLQEMVELVGRIRGGDAHAVRRRADGLVTAIELDEWRNTPGIRLSGGTRRLAGFLMAVVWPTPLVILDEPTNDVDPLRRRLLWRQIRQLAEDGSAVLLVTHNVLEAEQSVDRLAVIDQGRIVAQGTPSSLKADDRQRLRLQVNLVPGVDLPPPPAFAHRPLRLGHRWRLGIDQRDAPEAIRWAQDCMAAGIAEEYALGATTLEDLYIRLIGREDALEQAG